MGPVQAQRWLELQEPFLDVPVWPTERVHLFGVRVLSPGVPHLNLIFFSLPCTAMAKILASLCPCAGLRWGVASTGRRASRGQGGWNNVSTGRLIRKAMSFRLHFKMGWASHWLWKHYQKSAKSTLFLPGKHEARQLHLPPACLANCCSGRCASLCGFYGYWLKPGLASLPFAGWSGALLCS